MRAGLGLVVAGLLVGAGCQSEDVFQCQSDMQCVSSGVEGMCQPSGYCSFADGMCESGFRYGDSAPPGLAGQCVEPEATGSSGPDPTGNTTMLPAGPACAKVNSKPIDPIVIVTGAEDGF